MTGPPSAREGMSFCLVGPQFFSGFSSYSDEMIVMLPLSQNTQSCPPAFAANFMHQQVSCSLLFPWDPVSPFGVSEHSGEHTAVYWHAGGKGRPQPTWGRTCPLATPTPTELAPQTPHLVTGGSHGSPITAKPGIGLWALPPSTPGSHQQQNLMGTVWQT